MSEMNASPLNVNAKVWDREYAITVYQKSKSVWVAIGDYHSQRIEAKGRNQPQAIARWREAARYKGN